ncbi:L-type lectin-domain containing receptor kinase S.1 [Pyrus ussuriensis x Pyrus communis]|uniref:L-type lectin-domain containing receptor kinase S.1 n=1 Tax=Pyrus ussuriensis x Pyrus communis TaxID=2448454 RepID=A0A5N5ILU2_9ROSA|nr:L-type lectin-domain containing receptor kinase S.1 [Pyrus ussuriensis x Pyrus communis]
MASSPSRCWPAHRDSGVQRLNLGMDAISKRMEKTNEVVKEATEVELESQVSLMRVRSVSLVMLENELKRKSRAEMGRGRGG